MDPTWEIRPPVKQVVVVFRCLTCTFQINNYFALTHLLELLFNHKLCALLDVFLQNLLFLADCAAQSFMSPACGFPLLMFSCAASALSLRFCSRFCSRFVHTLMSFLTERLGLFYHVCWLFKLPCIL